MARAARVREDTRMENSRARRIASVPTRAKRYLVLGLLGAIVALVFLKIGFAVEDNWGHDAFTRWFGLGLFTLGLFAFFVCNNEKLLRNWRFWALSVTLLAIHLAGFAIVLIHAEEWKSSWFMVMVIEYPLFLLLRDKFVRANASVEMTGSLDSRGD